MIKGLYAAASAMLANLSRHGAISHNVANLDTPGFKQILVSMDDFKETRVVTPNGPSARSGLLRWVGNLGLGVEPTPEITDFTPGPIRSTGQPLDLALQGSGFFRVQTPNGERYTRDGRFLLDAEGGLVTVDGYPVLDEGGQPIQLEDGMIVIGQDGTNTVDGQEAARLGLAAFENPDAELSRDLPNTFAAIGQPTSEETGTVHQGFLEAANANAAELMTRMVSVSRAYEAAQKMVQTQDELLGRTISSLGSPQ